MYMYCTLFQYRTYLQPNLHMNRKTKQVILNQERLHSFFVSLFPKGGGSKGCGSGVKCVRNVNKNTEKEGRGNPSSLYNTLSIYGAFSREPPTFFVRRQKFLGLAARWLCHDCRLFHLFPGEGGGGSNKKPEYFLCRLAKLYKGLLPLVTLEVLQLMH